MLKNDVSRDFSDSPVVKTSPSKAGDVGSVPGRTEIQLRFHRLHDVAKKKINKIKPHSLQKSTQEQKYNKEARKYIQRFKKLQMF